MVQLSHPHLTTGKTMALTVWTFVGKVMSLLFNMLSRLVITEEIPHIQGKRNPSKMVGVARGHQRADTLRP